MESQHGRSVEGERAPQDLRQQRQQYLKRHISETEEDLLSLKSSYNSHSPINQLPVEILTCIFARLVSILAPERINAHGLGELEAARWLRVTRVCRHWRNAALDCGPLWSNILFVTPELAELMLGRSKSGPINIKLFYNNPWLEGTISTALSLNNRLQIVDLTGPMTEELLSLLSGPAGMLEDLTLRFGGYSVTNIPADLLRGAAPRLKRLVIEGFGIPRWDEFPPFHSLTYLRLRSTVFADTRPPMKLFLEYLQGMPHLETLDLIELLPKPDFTPPSTVVDLPALRSVRLQDSMLSMKTFASASRMPGLRSLRLIAQDLDEVFEGNFDDFIQEFAEMWRTKQHNIAKSLDIEEDFSRRGCGTSYRFGLESDLPYISEFWLSFRFSLTRTEVLSTIGSTLVDMAPLRSLEVSGCRDLSANVWRTFGRLRHLETITLYGTSACTLCRVLNEKRPPTPGRPQGDSRIQLFPALSTLDLQCLDPLDDTLWAFQTTSIFAFVRALKNRPKAHRIKMLRVGLFCGLSQGRYQYIAKSVPDLSVEWNGVLEELGGEGTGEEESEEDRTDDDESEDDLEDVDGSDEDSS